MATPESLKKTLETNKKIKRNQDGLRGIPELDPVNNKSITGSLVCFSQPIFP